MGNNILVDFNIVIDTDLGLINMMKKEYNNTDFVLDYINNMKDKVIIEQLLERTNKNPLSIIIKEEYKDSIDNLYKEFLEMEYDNILKHSSVTDIMNLMNTYINTGAVHVDIICKNKLEEQLINNLNISQLKVIVEKDRSRIDLSDYDTIFIKDYSDILNFKGVIAKNIFIGNYKFNLEDDNRIPLNDISLIVGKTNLVSIIDVYESNKYIKVKG